MMPWFMPTKPPPEPSEPTDTAPLAHAYDAAQFVGAVVHVVPEMLPKLAPTKPPTLTYSQVLLSEQLPLVLPRPNNFLLNKVKGKY
jgi:hypothetical protein